jgi:hypothetical protein
MKLGRGLDDDGATVKTLAPAPTKYPLECRGEPGGPVNSARRVAVYAEAAARSYKDDGNFRPRGWARGPQTLRSCNALGRDARHDAQARERREAERPRNDRFGQKNHVRCLHPSSSGAKILHRNVKSYYCNARIYYCTAKTD